MHTQNKGKPKKNNKTQAYSTPRAEARAGAGPGSRAQTGGAVGLRFNAFLRFSFFLYAYAIIGLEINIRLDPT